MTIKDVLIIGAGPAGSTAAFKLASENYKVALLEKNPEIISNPCGAGMASSVQRWFPFDLKPAVDNVIKEVQFTWNLSDQVIADISESEPFWIVQRGQFDELLRDKAANAGAEIIRPFNVIKLETEKKIWRVTSGEGLHLEGKTLIIADGSYSPWPELLNLGPKKQRRASTISIQLKGQGNLKKTAAKFEFGLVHHGFAWAFPLNDGVSLGIGTFLGGNQILKSENILNKMLPSLGFESSDGIRKEELLNIWNGHSNLHGDNVVLIGDAGSLADPFLAEGLRPALMSGCEAAKHLNYWLKGEVKDLSSYSDAIKKKWGKSMAWGKRIAQVFYRFPRVGYQLGVKRATAPKRIAEILSGEMSYEDIAQRVIRRLILQKN
ncbi:NAD(P)/FAD-dependent oxidoreductase [Prochlorococcus sp. MIT 1223]|uniref:NAD(P)/FAD-dependent oxidoreductase n=1 Tax=Prochlorococcus sp. MIT 1223 TaxID=3096217 RepID=UPI002A74C5B7|nr:NAD(P)/FAD-dependent oxidoreductase [Prochlorococcus sp. MIT 1223]